MSQSVPNFPAPARKLHKDAGEYLFFQAMPFILCLLAAIGSFAIYLTERQLEFLSCGGAFLTTCICLIPGLLQKDYDLFIPTNLVAITVFAGVSLRVFYIVSYNNERTRSFLMLGKHPEQLIDGISYLLLGLTAMVVGFLLPVRGFEVNRFPLLVGNEWNHRRFVIINWILTVIAVVSFVLYIWRLGVAGALAEFSVSKKRFIAVEGGGFSSLSYYRWGISLFTYAFLLLVAWISKRQIRLAAATGLVALGTLAALPPIFYSSRNELITTFILAALILHYARGKLRFIPTTSLACFAILVLVVLGVMRGAGYVGRGFQALTKVEASMFLDLTVGNRNFLGAPKTSHIIQKVPSALSYQYGKTFASLLVMPIPRTFWPDKPVRVGGMVEYQQAINPGGYYPVAPGLVAELYLNGGPALVPLGMALLGIALKFLYQSFRPHLHNRNTAVLYGLVIFHLSFTMVSSDFIGGMLVILRGLIPLIPLLFLITAPSKPAAIPTA